VVFDRGSTSALELIDAVTLKPRHRPKVPLGTIKNVQWHKSGSDVGFNLQSMKALVDVYSVSAATGAVERWTASESGGANLQICRSRDVSWKSQTADNRRALRPHVSRNRVLSRSASRRADDYRERPRFSGAMPRSSTSSDRDAVSERPRRRLRSARADNGKPKTR
jgi:hypothetical protein